ncbi:ferritin-like domain-containing protein [Natranaeroarchaeum sulfidigenes]|uniref:Ferritin-like domain n=1 Tax=Natranaeroarchaeum sulfidigenes TaxID=2784880 RepID=A0A897MNV8_9EURY|nr:ferritin-like domain-containing protein [Natranaeroarchaeum sulfidigenes]QSG02274.1 Ferritin-like domain [Natranaeroarchaeum sulfidigenes]
MSQDTSGDDGEPIDRTNNTRRQVIAGSAGAIGGFALGSTFGVGSAFADEHGDDEAEMPDDVPPEAVENEFEDDIEILNFALTLELLEADFYRQGLDNLDSEELINTVLDNVSHDKRPDTGSIATFHDKLQDQLFDELETIRDHEIDHAETLTATIEEFGGEPVEEPEFEFGEAVEDPAAFIATGVALEDTGVSAYAGAAPFIENEDVVPPALSIHSVEARHASFLRVLNAETGFPTPYDQPRSRSEVLDIASDFIVD